MFLTVIPRKVWAPMQVGGPFSEFAEDVQENFGILT